MQTLFKFRSVPRSFVRSVMGKPYTGEDLQQNRTGRYYGQTLADDKEKKSVTAPTTEKFTKAFQAYLDSRLTYEEMMNQSDAEKKKSLTSYIREGDLFTPQKECPEQSQVSEAKS